MKVDEIFNPTLGSATGKLAEKVMLEEYLQSRAQDPKVKAKVATQIANSPLIKMLASGDVPKPLSREEAEAVDNEIETLQTAISTTRARISGAIAQIDSIGLSDVEISFKVDVSKRHHLQKAIKSVFKVETDTITYSMYKAALEAKRELEEKEADDYVNVKWKNK